MRSRITKLLLGTSLLAALSGCTTVGRALNPYEDEFKCSKKAPFGTCETTMEVYSDLIAGPKTATTATVALEPGNDVPPGYEIVPSTDSLPTYSLSGADAKSTKDRYIIAKKEEAEAMDPTPFPQQVDAGDGMVYPMGGEKSIKGTSSPAPVPGYIVRPKPETAYRDASLAKAAKLLKEPVTPIVIPPLVMRILILPRKGDDESLNMAQFSYVMVDKPRWAMGDYLSALPEE